MNKLLRTMWAMIRSRRRPKLNILETATLDLRVRLTDIDILRHMNNGVYLSIADLGRMDLLVRSGVWAVFQERGWYPVVANATISYRKSLDLGARYQLQTRMVGIDERSVFMEQRFVVGGDIHARLFFRGRFLKRSRRHRERGRDRGRDRHRARSPARAGMVGPLDHRCRAALDPRAGAIRLAQLAGQATGSPSMASRS